MIGGLLFFKQEELSVLRLDKRNFLDLQTLQPSGFHHSWFLFLGLRSSILMFSFEVYNLNIHKTLSDLDNFQYASNFNPFQQEVLRS